MNNSCNRCNFMAYIFGRDNRNYWMGLSIIWIILLHSYQNLDCEWLKIIAGHGGRGVDVFFILSTFGLCFSYEKNNIWKYYGNRFKRLFPIYIVYLILLFLFFGDKFNDSKITLFICQITGLASFRRVDVEWYIPALICLYLLFPLLYKTCRWIYQNHWKIAILSIPLLTIFLTRYGRYFFFYHIPVRLVVIYIAAMMYFCVKESNERRLLTIGFVPAAVYFLLDGLNFYSLALLIPSLMILISKIAPPQPCKKIVGYVGKHTLEIYLAQSISIQYFAKYNPLLLDKYALYASLLLMIIVLSILFNISNRIWKIVDSKN